MTIEWPYHLPIQPDETEDEWQSRATSEIRSMAGSGGFFALLDLIERVQGDLLFAASGAALSGTPEEHRHAIAEAQGVKRVLQVLKKTVEIDKEPEDIVEKRARRRLDRARRMRGSLGATLAR